MRKPLKLVFIALLASLALSACTTYERKVTPFRMPEAYPNMATVADASIAPHELAHGFIFYLGEAKQPKELRISIKTTDTNEVFPLILKF